MNRSELNAAIDRIQRGEPYDISQYTITKTTVQGKPVTFCGNFRKDPIQRAHRNGGFFDPDDLEIIASAFKKGGTFIDIGANVGNHGMYAAMFLGADRVIPIEPNPQVYQLILAHVAANNLARFFELQHLGIGISDSEEHGFGMEQRTKNLGAAKMLPEQGRISVKTGDSILANEAPAFIKIDVEGMELKALNGLRKTITAHKPPIFIEVTKANSSGFDEFIQDVNYTIVESHSPHPQHYMNHLAVPNGQ
jgi:FkbM family methyltransferase